MRTLDKECIAYIAGFWDGEGCFSLANGHIKLSLANTNPMVMQFISRALFSGSIYNSLKERKRNYPQRPQLVLQIGAEPAIEAFCRLVLPYLIVKREECEVVLEYLEFKEELRLRRKYQQLHPTPADEQHLFSLCDKCQMLKRRSLVRNDSMQVD